MYEILFNPLSGNGKGYDRVLALKEILKNEELQFRDIREIKDYKAFLETKTADDTIVIAGGDGTLNQFINFTDGLTCPAKICYYAVGSGNDFKHDIAPEETGIIPMEEYFRDLPIVTVNGKSYRFLNGIGYGIDGYCCEVGDELSKKSDKPVNYAGIAIKGLLFHYKPTHAKVTVDGEVHEFDRVWLAPSMNGRFYGGGMMIAPAQVRLADPEQKQLTLVVMHGSGKLKTLIVFPSIFKGEHINHPEMVTTLTGKEIKVEFDRPVALQIDGETVLGVTEYQARVAVPAKKETASAAETV